MDTLSNASIRCAAKAYRGLMLPTSADQLARGEVDGGILLYWTGTSVSIAANKVPCIRAALCGDADPADAVCVEQVNDIEKEHSTRDSGRFQVA